MRSTKLLVLLTALAALAACKKEGLEGPLAGCRTASYASFCSADAQCCSFGCVYGTCMPNPARGRRLPHERRLRRAPRSA